MDLFSRRACRHICRFRLSYDSPDRILYLARQPDQSDAEGECPLGQFLCRFRLSGMTSVGIVLEDCRTTIPEMLIA